MGDPKRLKTPTSQDQDILANIINGAINPNPKYNTGLDLGQWLQSKFNLPAYAGEIGAGVDPNQTAAATGLSSYVPGMVSNIDSAAKGLTDVANGNYLDDIYAKLDANRRLGLARDLNDTREQFSSQGLRNSTAFANAMGVRQSESEAGLNSTLAQILPQLLQAKTNAAAMLPGLAGAGTDLYGKQFDIGSNLRNSADTLDVRKYQDFLNQRGLMEQLVPLLLGLQPNYGPSVGQQIGQGLVGAGTIAASLAK